MNFASLQFNRFIVAEKSNKIYNLSNLNENMVERVLETTISNLFSTLLFIRFFVQENLLA